MTKKIAPEEYEQWLAENRPDLRVLEPYVDSRTPIKHLCLKHDREWLAMPSNIKFRKASGCPECKSDKARKQRFDPGHYPLWLKENRPDIVALEPYVTALTPILHRGECGHQWETAPNHIKHGDTSCPTCADRQRSEVQRMGEDEYVRWLAENRPEITLIGEMRRAGEGCLHKCDKGDDHTWMGIPSRIMHGRGCPHCSGRIPQDYREWLAEFRPDLTLLEPYRNSLTKTKHQCGEGHVFTAPPGAIKQGRGCPECSDKSSDFDAVYVWEWLVDGEGTGVYKGGLTSVKLGDRRIVRCARTNDMDYRIVFLLRTGGLQARAIEQALLDSGHKVEMPDHVVDGRTEFRYFHPDSRAMATINQLKAIAEGKPLQTQKLVAQQ